ncbi:conserved hypothetical protein [delta proteobacterium NaphS2]|nr:conserved hypothetical protein [delta proteobacterium NaphS2]
MIDQSEREIEGAVAIKLPSLKKGLQNHSVNGYVQADQKLLKILLKDCFLRGSYEAN